MDKFKVGDEVMINSRAYYPNRGVVLGVSIDDPQKLRIKVPVMIGSRVTARLYAIRPALLSKIEKKRTT